RALIRPRSNCSRFMPGAGTSCQPWFLSLRWQRQWARRLQVRQRIQHEVSDKYERAEEQGKGQRGRIRHGVGDPVSDPLIDLPRLEHYVPTVEAQKAAQIDAETGQRR